MPHLFELLQGLQLHLGGVHDRFDYTFHVRPSGFHTSLSWRALVDGLVGRNGFWRLAMFHVQMKKTKKLCNWLSNRT